MKLSDKTVVITGAAQGLGASIARAAAKEGADLVLLDFNESKLKETAEAIATNAHVDYHVCDIRNIDSIRSVLNKIAKIDILINNAGVWTDNELEASDPSRAKLAFDTNAVGTILITNEVVARLRATNDGYIFNVISTAGDALSPSGDNRDWATYGATKWALAGFTKTLRDSLVGTGIKVSGFFPGGFESNLYENADRPDAHSQPWMMPTDAVADAVMFALTRPDDVLVESMTITKFIRP